MRLRFGVVLLLLASCATDTFFGGGGGDDDDDDDVVDFSEPVFSMDRVHEIEIVVAPEDVQRLVPHSEDRVPAQFTYDDDVYMNATVRLKGGIGSVATLDEKPGFSVQVPLRGLEKIVLNAFRQDQSMVDEHLGYEIYRRVGIPSPRTAYGWVTFNGQPYGIYLVVEAVNAEFTMRHFGDSSGNRYEGECCGEIAVDRTQLRNNGEESGDKSDLAALVDVMWNSPDESYLSDLGAIVDVEAFVRGWGVESMVVHWDSYNYNRNNFYIYHRPSDDRFIFLPHGLDQLFNDLQADPLRPPSGQISARMLGLPDGLALFEEELLDVAENAWDVDELVAYVDEADVLIADWVERDTRKYRSTEEQRGALAAVRDYVVQRPEIVLRRIAADCGNGTVDAFEECDDGNRRSEDGCSSDCRREFCGDGIRQAGLGEACDGLGCRGDCSGPSACGDGALDVGEECDDGNRDDDDGCNRHCENDRCGDLIVQPSRGEVCDGAFCRPDCSAEGECGDGVLDVGEDCDDGNQADGDGCEGDCGFDDCETIEGPDGQWTFCPVRRSWDQARLRCLGLGLVLGLPANAEENEFAASRAFERNGGPWWIGFSDRRFEGVWVSGLGAAPDYQPWGGDEPNGGEGQNCAVLEPRFEGGWNDKGCDEQYPMVCAEPELEVN